MALYLGGGEKLKIALHDGVCKLFISSASTVLNSTKLLSSDGYILKDVNGLYLTIQEDK